MGSERFVGGRTSHSGSGEVAPVRCCFVARHQPTPHVPEPVNPSTCSSPVIMEGEAEARVKAGAPRRGAWGAWGLPAAGALGSSTPPPRPKASGAAEAEGEAEARVLLTEKGVAIVAAGAAAGG